MNFDEAQNIDLTRLFDTFERMVVDLPEPVAGALPRLIPNATKRQTYSRCCCESAGRKIVDGATFVP
jgi:hypothetical protein